MIFLPYIIAFAIAYVLTAIPRYFFYARKLAIPKYSALIPIYSHIKLGQLLGYPKYAVVGSVCRTAGIVLSCTSQLISQYIMLLKMARFYGIILGTWTAPDIDWLLSALLWTGISLYLFGACCRLLMAKKVNTLFGFSNRALNFCGMVLPFVHESILAFSKNTNVVALKSIKEMTNEEYSLYLKMSQ
jgi:hypothetical protein